ncbi:hypothetical protein ACHAPI_007566 [Fusarium lateritium]
MKLNLTVDVSRYHDGNTDGQLANKNVYVDTVALQMTHDFPRWKDEGALLQCAPAGFDKIYSGFKDIDTTFYGYTGIAWQLVWNADKLKGKTASTEYTDFLAPQYKGKLALTYSNDDDTVLFQFDQMSPYVATFTSAIGLTSGVGPLNATFPKKSNFALWPGHTAILKDVLHPEGAKLL